MPPAEIVFQVNSWHTEDVDYCDDSDESEQEDSEYGSRPAAAKDNDKYMIKMFGVDENGESVGCTVVGFTPHFYVKLAEPWSRMKITKLDTQLRTKLGKKYQNSYIDIKSIKKRDFWGFNNNTEYWFLRFRFVSQRLMKTVARTLPYINPDFKLYENNIDPFIRFIHIRNIQPAGWVSIPAGKYQPDDVLPSKCGKDIKTNWENVCAVEREAIAPMLVASFDLECMSSDGDFPVPRKDYAKMSTEFYNMYQDCLKERFSSDEFSRKAIGHVCQMFTKKWLVPFIGSEANPQKVAATLSKHFGQIMSILKGDPAVMEKAFSDRFESVFKNVSDLSTYDKAYNTKRQMLEKMPKESAKLIGIFNSPKVRDIRTPTGRRKYMSACFMNSLARYTDVFDHNNDPETIIDELMKLLLAEKDGIIITLTKYLNNVMPLLKGDEIIQIGTTFHRYGEQECSRKVIFNLGTCEQLPDGIEVIECESERDMLLQWADLVNETDPDVITGWNIFGFDFSYVYERSIELGCRTQFCQIGRFKDRESQYKETKLSSSALGDNLMKYINMEGRTIIDLMKVVQRDHKLDSYKLDNVANHFMKMNKHDVSPQDIFRLYRGTAKDRSVIADYCVQDCQLCNKLMMSLEIIANNVGMANVCSVPMGWIFMRGQGVKIFSLVAKECKERGFLIPCISKPFKEKRIIAQPMSDDEGDGDDAGGMAHAADAEPEEEEDTSGYEGAIVLEPKTGIYIDTPIVVLDYASLYPSSMISENLSHDSMVLDPQFDNLPGVEYLDITYDIYEGTGDEKVRVGERVCRFVQPPNGEKGIIPNILNHLLKNRKITRKRMGMKQIVLSDGTELEGFYSPGSGKVTHISGPPTPVNDADVESVKDKFDAFGKAVLDGLQLAYKITANSLYGQIGARTSPIYLKDIAACTTATGRKMIMLAKDFVEKHFDSEVVYGDSVASYTPVYVRANGTTLDICTIDELATKYGDDQWRAMAEGKESCELAGVETWTDKGWTYLYRVIRHTLAPHKKMIRVLTHTGVVDVTDDHSLLSVAGEPITSKEVQLGTELLHNDLPSAEMSPKQKSVTEKEAYMMGLMYNKNVPTEIMTSSISVRRAFLQGLCDADVYEDILGYKQFDQDTQISAANIFWLATSVGFSASINTRPDKPNIFSVTMTTNSQRKNPNAIKKMEEIAYTGYVYDLTTDNHHFAAGVGRMIVHNTDSLFLRFTNINYQNEPDKETMLTKCRDMGIKCSDEIQKILKEPHCLEWEKIFWPFILFSKKRYVANKYEYDPTKFKQNSMGIVLKRRDNAPIVKTIYGGVIDLILNKHDVKESITFLQRNLKDLIAGKFQMEDLIVTKTLKGHYKDPDKIAHKVLANRIAERQPGNAPQANDRIPYVYVEMPQAKPGQRLLQGDRIEHPDYIRERKLKPDYTFYITNQIMNPVLQLYALALEQIDGYRKKDDQWDAARQKLVLDGKSEKVVREKVMELKEMEVKRLLFDPILHQLENRKNNQREITEYFKVAR